ncbi:beta-L-arabinofuranosidase domain-containing protein [Tundrisphaera lichenicola]|uniref:beta-L-arabinofuranosidase domain-containing protein n=1 Tax=Tundrisphaera lichenicola TaxID=2029860 RepID=UPI003EBB56B1
MIRTLFLSSLTILSMMDDPLSAGEGKNLARRTPGSSVSIGGPVGDRLRDVTQHWLMEAPSANPAMLGMFRDRDRRPYRNLLPWSGEFAGKYLTGATGVLDLTGDPALKDRLARFVAEWIALQDSDGYLGPFPRGHRLTGMAPNVDGKDGPTWDAWGHYHALLGLLLWEERTGDPAALAAATRIGDLFCDRFLGEKRPRLVDTGSTEMNLAPAHALFLLHRRTGTTRYRDLAEQVVREFAAEDSQGRPMAGDYLRRGLAGEPFYKTPKPRWESLHPILALAESYRETGDPSFRTAFENLWWSIVETDRHNNGGFSSGEQAQGNPYHRGAIETCCTVAWMAMSVEMLRLTANPIVADELELSTLNSAMGFFAPSGRWSTYNTPMDGDRKASFHEIGFQCRPGSPELNCCSVNAVRGLGLIGEWAVLVDDEGLFVNWYGPGSASVPLASGSRVKLTQETDYPLGGKVEIRVDPERPGAFAVRLRIPQWSTRTSVKVNDQAIPDVMPGRYLTLDREWKPGDRIALELDLSPRFWVGERESEGLVAAYRGPILLAYDRRLNEIDPDDLPELDANTIGRAAVVDRVEAAGTMLLLDVPTPDGRKVRLCDFAGAGSDGSPYRSWLKVSHADPSAFRPDAPRRTGPALDPE